MTKDRITPQAGRPSCIIGAAVDAIVASLDHDTASALLASPAEALHRFNFGLGMALRNRFGLWQMQGELYEDLQRKQGGGLLHPDEASAVLVRLVWRELRRQHRRRRASQQG